MPLAIGNIINPNDLRFDVLVIYQGDAAKEFYEHVATFLASGMQDIAQIRPRLTKYNDNAPTEDIYGKFWNDLLGSSAAIALVTEDTRYASEAGNLWFEVGLWIAEKGLDSLLICQQKGLNDGANKSPVEIISDMRGRPAPRFKDKKELDPLIQGHIINLRDRLFAKAPEGKHDGNGHYLDFFRITDTLGCGVPKWTPRDLSSCIHREEECPEKLESIKFISELLRMGRSAGELREIQNCLLSIGFISTKLVNLTLYQKNRTAKDRIRQSLMDLMYEEISRLENIAKDLLTRSDSQAPTDDEYWHWKRLEKYLYYRVEKAVKENRFVPKDVRIATKIKWASEFCQWARKYMLTFQNSDFYLKGKEHSLAEETQRFGQYAWEVAHVLGRLNSEYFEECRAIMKDKFLRINDHNDMWNAFKNAKESLPHNQDSPIFPEIWPRKNPN